jgi:hypothetical protein
MATRGSPVAWEGFYKTARWRRLRKFQLMQHPLCKFCLQRGGECGYRHRWNAYAY